jgi:uncharacterized protein YdeI (YjbR/CyaY-like superfamily)
MAPLRKKSNKLTGHQQVVEYLNKLEHPLKTEIEEVRSIILSANNDLTEHIKWNAPSFCYNNEDRITFNLRGKDYFQLVFHCGAKVKDHPHEEYLFEDTTGLLNWAAKDRATAKFYDLTDVKSKEEKLLEVIRKWIAATSL